MEENPEETEEIPRGDLREHRVPDKKNRLTDTDVKLAGELWDIEYSYLSLKEYVAIAPGVQGTVERKLVVAEAMKPKMNGEDVDWEDIDPTLGLALANYLDRKLSDKPGKNC
jgi:hypothetical protein